MIYQSVLIKEFRKYKFYKSKSRYDFNFQYLRLGRFGDGSDSARQASPLQDRFGAISTPTRALPPPRHPIPKKVALRGVDDSLRTQKLTQNRPARGQQESWQAHQGDHQSQKSKKRLCCPGQKFAHS